MNNKHLNQQERRVRYWGAKPASTNVANAPQESALNFTQTREPTIMLAPRFTSVSNLLSSGLSRKAIADELSISIHTLNGYIKEIYALFGVHSNVEFMLAYSKYLSNKVKEGR